MRSYADDDDPDPAEVWPGQRGDPADEGPDERDLRAADDVKCVHCGRYIHLDSDMCPFCKMWQSDAVNRSRKPLWFVVTVVVLAAVLLVFWIFLAR
jgi:hypothetical protein